jgi:eukaryotic-like serine/threonine-protein kinase
MTDTDRLGTRFGNYHLTQLLESGSCATVYLGVHRHLGRQAAVKVLQPYMKKKDQRDFLLKARMIARVVHPGIIRVLEYGVEENIPFLVMQYAPSGSLRQQYPQGTQVPLRTILSIVKQVASALDYIHQQKLIHRNIKPENLLLGRNEEILVSDFGIDVAPQSSHSRSVQGTFTAVGYMAPEQIRGKPCTASDQYALGIAIYEWLCGERPFNGSDYVEVATQHLHISPTPLDKKVPSVSPAVSRVVLQALAKDPSERFKNLQALASTLEEASLLESALPSSSTRSPLITADAPTSSQLSITTNAHPSRRAIVVGLSAVMVIGGGITALEFHPWQQTQASTPHSLQSHQPIGTALWAYEGHTKSVYALAWSRDGRQIASWSEDNMMRVWDATTRKTLATQAMAQVLAWSPDWQRIASVDRSKNVQIWSVDTGHVIKVYEGQKPTGRPPVNSVVWSPNGKSIASGFGPYAAQVWDATTGSILFSYGNLYHDYALPMAWAPDSQRIAFASDDNKVQVWDITQHRGPLYSYTGHANAIDAVAWSYDGRRIASSTQDRIIHVWDALTGKNLVYHSSPLILPEGESSQLLLAWSPDNKRLASFYYLPTLSIDQQFHIWDAHTGSLVYVFPQQDSPVNGIAWSPDGKHIASAHQDGIVRVWQAV